MQISDSGFRGEINIVSPGRRADFSHVNARWNPALLHVNTLRVESLKNSLVINEGNTKQISTMTVTLYLIKLIDVRKNTIISILYK